jgi:class 3 adenylate cyclase
MDDAPDISTGTDDPAVEAERANLVRLVEASGGSAAQLAAATTLEQLRRLAVELLFLGSPALYTADEAGARAGVSGDEITALRRVVGLPPVAPDERRYTDDDVHLAEVVNAASEFFGTAATMQLLRVVGAAMARVADAAVSTFVTTASTDAGATDNVEANQTAASMMPQLLQVMDTVLRRHVVQASRPATTRVKDGFEAMQLGVGFVDLVGSSELARLAPLGVVGEAVAEFERRAADVVTDRGGRVVKFIGDEVMFVIADPRAVCEVSLAILASLAADASLPPARAGAAYGDVLVRDADVFGPVVNLAARATKAAGPGGLVISEELRDQLGADAAWTFEPLPPQELKGFEMTALFEVH